MKKNLSSPGAHHWAALRSAIAAPMISAPWALLWAVGMGFLLFVAFGLGRVAERRQVGKNQADAAAPTYVQPAPPVVEGRDFELVVIDPVTARAEGRSLAELWIHHRDGSASRAEIRPDGRGSVVHIDGEGVEVER